MQCMTWMSCLGNWEFPGRVLKTFLSGTAFFTSGFSGTLHTAKSVCQKISEKNMHKLLQSGAKPRLIPSKMPRSFLESFCMPAVWSPEEGPISPVWKPSRECFMIVRSCHGLYLKEQLKICTGGSEYFVNQWRDQFLSHKNSSTSKLTLMQAQPLALASLLAKNGEPGTSYLAGKGKEGTLDEQKQQASSYWSQSLADTKTEKNASKSLKMTEALWKAGGLAEAGTKISTSYLNMSMKSVNSSTSKICTRYVPSEFNPADGPSRGRYPSKSLLLPSIPIPDILKDWVVDFNQQAIAPQDRACIIQSQLPKGSLIKKSQRQCTPSKVDELQAEEWFLHARTL